MVQVSKRRKTTVSLKPLNPKMAVACCGPIDDLLDVDLFKALSDPTRVRLLGCLAKCGRACSVTELAECCAVDFSVVSRHMAMLERAGVVASTKAGRVVSYTAEYAALSKKFASLAEAIAGYAPMPTRLQIRASGGACCAK